jgi:hypothetical protein
MGFVGSLATKPHQAALRVLRGGQYGYDLDVLD